MRPIQPTRPPLTLTFLPLYSPAVRGTFQEVTLNAQTKATVYTADFDEQAVLTHFTQMILKLIKLRCLHWILISAEHLHSTHSHSTENEPLTSLPTEIVLRDLILNEASFSFHLFPIAQNSTAPVCLSDAN